MIIPDQEIAELKAHILTRIQQQFGYTQPGVEDTVIDAIRDYFSTCEPMENIG